MVLGQVSGMALVPRTCRVLERGKYRKKLWLQIRKTWKKERWSRRNYFPITRLWTTFEEAKNGKRGKESFLASLHGLKGCCGCRAQREKNEKLPKCVYEPSTENLLKKRTSSSGRKLLRKKPHQGDKDEQGKRFKFRGFLIVSVSVFQFEICWCASQLHNDDMQIPQVSVAGERASELF